MSELTMTDEFQATGDLHRIKEHTISPGVIEGEIVDVDPDKANVTVKRLTDGETFTQRYDVPKSWSNRYEFVRLVESQGYNAASVELLVGDTVKVDVSGRRGKVIIDRNEWVDKLMPVHAALFGWVATLSAIVVIPPGHLPIWAEYFIVLSVLGFTLVLGWAVPSESDD